MTNTTTRQSRDDRDLLDLCRRGDDRAWAELLDAYERYVFSIPRAYGLSPHDAADITQQVFGELVRRLDEVNDVDALGAWLATVTRRATWRLIARSKPAPAVIDLDDPAEDVDPWHEWMDAWNDRRWVAEALTALSPACRDLLYALYLDPEEPSYAQISERLGRPIGSIGPTRARCLDKLRLVMGRLGDRA